MLFALKLPAEVRRKLISEGEKSAKANWPLLTARDYMRFRRNGDRASYEKFYFQRRSRLIDLVVAECCEHSGRFTLSYSGDVQTMDDLQNLTESSKSESSSSEITSDEVIEMLRGTRFIRA